VRFDEVSLRLVLPLAHRQNWTILFGQFARSGNNVMLREFVSRARRARGTVDVGANAGLYTYHAAAVSPQVPLLALEPIVELADLLRANLYRNGRAAARVANVAASDMAGEAEFFVADSDEVSSLQSNHVQAYEGNAGSRRLVRTATLDQLVRERGFEHVDLIKIDVEGHERRVLDGAAAILDRHRPVLVMETGHEADGDRAAIHDRLARLGYRMLGILLDYGMAPADWPAYAALDPPFRAGDAHNLLLVPDEVSSRVSEEEPVPPLGRGPSRH
jgi:FkbM family methyltransferase